MGTLIAPVGSRWVQPTWASRVSMLSESGHMKNLSLLSIGRQMPSNLLKRGAAGYASVDLSQQAKRDAYALRTPYLADFAAGRTRELVRWPLGICLLYTSPSPRD